MSKLELFCIRVGIYRVSRDAHNKLRKSNSGISGMSCQWVDNELSTHPLYNVIRVSVCGDCV